MSVVSGASGANVGSGQLQPWASAAPAVVSSRVAQAAEAQTAGHSASSTAVSQQQAVAMAPPPPPVRASAGLTSESSGAGVTSAVHVTDPFVRGSEASGVGVPDADVVAGLASSPHAVDDSASAASQSASAVRYPHPAVRGPLPTAMLAINAARASDGIGAGAGAEPPTGEDAMRPPPPVGAMAGAGGGPSVAHM